MLKKFSGFAIAFFLLALSNIFIASVYMKRVSKQDQINQILAEIEDSKSVASELPAASDSAVGATLGDARVANLKNFFRKYNSPLFDHAQRIVEVSDKYQFDYRLLPAIAMQESGLCRSIPNNSYNCWGWGIYGRTVTRFESYDDAIETVGLGLRTHYLDKGFVTPSQIMSKYTPSSSGSWARGVNTFLKVLE